MIIQVLNDVLAHKLAITVFRFLRVDTCKRHAA